MEKEVFNINLKESTNTFLLQYKNSNCSRECSYVGNPVLPYAVKERSVSGRGEIAGPGFEQFSSVDNTSIQ